MGDDIFTEVVRCASAGHSPVRTDDNQAESPEGARQAGGTGSHRRRRAGPERCARGPATTDPATAAIASPARPGSAGRAAAGAAGSNCGDRRATEGIRSGGQYWL